MQRTAASGEWNGWGGNVANTRYRPNGGLTAADLPKLKLKWAFGYRTVTSARAQPAMAGGRLFVASENGEVHALDPKTGCTYWTFKAQAGVRTAIVGRPVQDAQRASGQAVFFGDARANAYAVDARPGKQIWVRKVDDHRVGRDHRRADLSQRPPVRAGAGAERGRPGRPRRATSAARSAAASRRSTPTPAR